MPNRACWDCGGPTTHDGWRCERCNTKPLPRRRRNNFSNQPAVHDGKEGMFAGFALLRERINGATVKQAIKRVQPRFPRLDWDRIKCEPKASTKSAASADASSNSTTRPADARPAGGKSSSNGAAHAD